jgi:hypothetical protein
MKDPKVHSIVQNIERVVIDFKSGEDYKKELMANMGIFGEIAASISGKK